MKTVYITGIPHKGKKMFTPHTVTFEKRLNHSPKTGPLSPGEGKGAGVSGVQIKGEKGIDAIDYVHVRGVETLNPRGRRQLCTQLRQEKKEERAQELLSQQHKGEEEGGEGEKGHLPSGLRQEKTPGRKRESGSSPLKRGKKKKKKGKVSSASLRKGIGEKKAPAPLVYQVKKASPDGNAFSS